MFAVYYKNDPLPFTAVAYKTQPEQTDSTCLPTIDMINHSIYSPSPGGKLITFKSLKCFDGSVVWCGVCGQWSQIVVKSMLTVVWWRHHHYPLTDHSLHHPPPPWAGSKLYRSSPAIISNISSLNKSNSNYSCQHQKISFWTFFVFRVNVLLQQFIDDKQLCADPVHF